MISVGSRDGRKRLGLGIEMEETELEEGEAIISHDEHKDSTMDPDIALSYIGEKVQNVLGHLQKDFEGGVSAENLGAKFGGYGSFLPTYQRSPSWSHARSPVELHNYDSPRSPKKLHLEDQRQNFVGSGTSPSAKSHAASGKAVLVGNSLKDHGYLQPKCVEESSLKGSGIKKPLNPSDQRTLKVRIKVGSENLSTQKNAEIYSGLGLVVSPSSSLDDSPTTSEGQCGKLLHVPEESPTSILQIMTSCPGELLLSPLSEDLIHLTEKRKIRGKCENKHLNKTSIESSGMLGNGSLSIRSNQKILVQKKFKLHEKDDAFSMGLANQKNNGDKDKSFALLKKEKETEIDTLGCEELISNALKLPLLSSTQHTIANPAKDVSTVAIVPQNALKDGKGESLSEFMEKEHLDNESAHENGRFELGGMLGSTGKVSECKNGNATSNIAAFPQANAPKAEKSHDMDQFESNASKGRKALRTAGAPETLKQFLKGESVREEGLKPALDKSSTGGKGNLNVGYSICDQDDCVGKDELIVESSLTYKGSKNSHTNCLIPKNDLYDLQKDNEKPGDRYKEFFGDVEFEDDNESFSGEMASSGKLKDPDTKRSLSEDHYVFKEKHNDTNPEKPVPPETTIKLHLNNSFGASVGMASVDARHSDIEHPNSAVQTASVSGKRKLGSIKAANSNDLDGSTQSLNLQRKSLTTSGKMSNLNSENHSPSLDTCGHQHMWPSTSAVENYLDTKKEKVSLVNSSDANLKLWSKQGADVEDSRASKRIKSEELHFDSENWTSDNGGTSLKAGCGLTDLSNNTSGNDWGKYNNHSDLSGEAKTDTVSCTSTEKHVPGTLNGALHHPGKCDEGAVRKRIQKEPHDSQIHTEPISSAGRHHLDSSDFMEEMCASELQKEKKVKVSKSGGKVTSGSKSSMGTDRKNGATKDQHNGHYLSNSWEKDCFKSDVGSAWPLVAANSSPSKVSGSHRHKTNGQEIKVSPIESVSLSPLRFSNADRVTSSKKNLVGQDDFHDSGSLSAISQRRLPGGEDERGSDRTGTVKRDRILTINDHVTDASNDHQCQSNQYGSVKHYSERCKVEETNTDQSHGSGFHAHKSGKCISNDETLASVSDLDKVDISAFDSSHDSLNHVHLNKENSKSRRSESDENSANPSKGEKVITKKDGAGGTSNENSKGQSLKKFCHDGQDAVKSQDKKHNLQLEHDNGKLPKKSNQAEVNGGGKSHSLPPLARVQTETVASLPLVSGSQKENSVKTKGCDNGNGDTLREPNRRNRPENPNSQPVRYPTPNSHKVRDVEAPSPLRRDSSSHAANNALKEAKDLKHVADRLKNSGPGESIGYYFQAALKFLHGASLLESGSSEAMKHNELMRAMHIYSSTAKLCKFCAHEYEKLKDMAAAALAYKCMEVAYLRVVYSTHTSASKDWNELQTPLQIIPSGESPSSSASDIDNLNHLATTDKAALVKVVGSPQVSGSHIITSQNRSGLMRILNFAQDVNFAMEASRKSRIAFGAATSRLGETSQRESISSVKEALDFNFHDVEGLLRLVRIAMEAIIH